MIFGWDDDKNRSNQKKHRIDFETAALVFADPNWVLRQDRMSRPAKLVRVSAESIWSKPLTKAQTASLNAMAKRQQRGDDSHIDFSDIPELTDAQHR